MGKGRKRAYTVEVCVMVLVTTKSDTRNVGAFVMDKTVPATLKVVLEQISALRWTGICSTIT